jgi:HPt (histidine-containing phosphotransfer) domain-containing protein
MLAHDSQAMVLRSEAVAQSGEDQAALDPGIFETLRTTLAPSALLEIYAVFLSDTRQRLALLGEPNASGLLSQVVHTIRGSAGMIGATQIAALAERLERDPDPPSKLLRACEHLQATLREEGLAL